MEDFRVKAWLDGELPDEALTVDEIEWLQNAVLEAIAKKLGAVKPTKELQ